MRPLIALVAVFALAQSACSFGRSVSSEAFRRASSFAIVNVNTAERVSYTEPTMVRAPGGGMDMSSTGFDAGPAAGIFPETKAAAVRALSRSHRFPVGLERGLHDLRTRLVLEARGSARRGGPGTPPAP